MKKLTLALFIILFTVAQISAKNSTMKEDKKELKQYKLNKDFLKNMKTETLKINGLPVNFPIKRLDWTNTAAYYTTSLKISKKLLPKGLTAASIFPGKAVISISSIHYRETDNATETYDGFVISILVKYKKENLSSIFPLYMIVNSEQVAQGGKLIFGYPMIKGNIKYKETKKYRLTKVYKDKKLILSLKVKKAKCYPKNLKVKIYAKKGKKLIRNLVDINGFSTIKYDNGASIKLGNHKISKAIKALKLSKNSTFYIYAPRYQSKIHKIETLN